MKNRAGTRYRLRDFLPPFASAVMDTNFLQELLVENRNRKIDFSLSNCWSTAYSFSRLNANDFSVFFAADRDIVAKMSDWRHGEYILENESGDPNTVIDGAIGDIIFLYDEDGLLLHAAVYIDYGLWFEKLIRFRKWHTD